METFVKDFLSSVKATRYTYYNLDKTSIEEFKKLYSYLKKHKDKKIYVFSINRVKKILNDKNELDFLRKYKAMKLISENIEH